MMRGPSCEVTGSDKLCPRNRKGRLDGPCYVLPTHHGNALRQLVNYFGVFPEESASGVDKHGHPLPLGTMHMSRKGNDLVRSYLWNVSRPAIRHNPAIRALYG